MMKLRGPQEFSINKIDTKLRVSLVFPRGYIGWEGFIVVIYVISYQLHIYLSM